ncbi:MAG: MerC domain-containing protein [Sphingomonadales bacterium]
MAAITRLQEMSDRLAVFLSGLCVAHCLIIPVALLLAPVLGLQLIEDAAAHQILFAVAVPVSIVGLGLGFRRHRRLTSLLMAALGLGLMYGGLLQTSLVFEEVLTVAGVLLVAAAHIQNRRRLSVVTF